MEKLLELEKKLKEAKESLEKNAMMGYDNMTGMPPGTSGMGMDPMMNKQEHRDKEDEKADKKLIADAMDEHNEKKHGEDKDEDSAHKDMKKNVNMAYGDDREMIKYDANGQWRMEKAIVVDQKPDGKYDVPVKEVYDGDDKFKERGGKSVEGDKGKTIKVSDKEKKELSSL